MKTRKRRKDKTHEDVLELYCDIIEIEIIEEAEINVSDQPSPIPTCQKRPRKKSTQNEKSAILKVLEASSFLVTTDWQWIEEGKRLQNKPSPFFLMIWRKNPEPLCQQSFELCQESEGGSRVWHVYLHPSDALRLYVSM